MSSSKIRLGILGGGGNSLIGVLHRIASSMFDKYQIVGGVFNPIWDENIDFANKIGLPEDRIYIDFETLIEQIKRDIRGFGEREVSSRVIGETVMKHLRKIDEVAFVRFASVYRSFQDPLEFSEEVKKLSND